MKTIYNPGDLSIGSHSESFHGCNSTIEQGGTRDIQNIVTSKTIANLELKKSQKTWKKVLEASMKINKKTSDLENLFSGFLYRILPNRIRSELGEVMHELDFFKKYSNVLDLLNSLNQTGSLSGLEFTNYIAGKKHSIDVRAKYISEQIGQLIVEIKNSKDYPQ